MDFENYANRTLLVNSFFEKLERDVKEVLRLTVVDGEMQQKNKIFSVQRQKNLFCRRNNLFTFVTPVSERIK